MSNSQIIACRQDKECKGRCNRGAILISITNFSLISIICVVHPIVLLALCWNSYYPYQVSGMFGCLFLERARLMSFYCRLLTWDTGSFKLQGIDQHQIEVICSDDACSTRGWHLIRYVVHGSGATWLKNQVGFVSCVRGLTLFNFYYATVQKMFPPYDMNLFLSYGLSLLNC